CKTTSGHWSRRTICKFLRNRKYVGDMPWNETHQGKYSSWKNGAVKQSGTINRQFHRHDEEDWIVVPDLIPPLIDRDTFTRAQAAMAANKKRTSPVKDDPYLFTRTLVCGDCGAFMTGHYESRYPGKSYVCAKYKEYGTKECHRN